MSYRAVPPPPQTAPLGEAPRATSASHVPSIGSYPPVARSDAPPGPTGREASRSASTLGVAGSIAALLGVPALGLALLNLARARDVGAFGRLPEFAQRIAYEASMGRVLVFAGLSLGVGVVALGLSGFAHRATSGRVGLALGGAVFVGSLFAHVARATASFTPVSDASSETPPSLGLDDEPVSQRPSRDRSSPSALETELTRAAFAAQIAAEARASEDAPMASAQPARSPAGSTSSEVRGKPAGAPKGTARGGAASVSGSLPAEVIQRVVRQGFGAYRACYEQGLKNDPDLAGRVSVSFTIGRSGSVSSVSAGGDLPSTVKSCVAAAFRGLSFPSPENGVVNVTYPLVFTPGK